MRDFAVGSLVSARGREWVVLPDSDDELLLLRPLGGSEDEATGVYLPIEGEDVCPATFDLPAATARNMGDHRSCRLLRDALRLGFRSSAGPFRSFGRIAVEPRPYQLVPLLMALRLEPVRLLIADDVGIGKTIEAGLVAREMLEQGDADRLAVLCPPHLAEQWQGELEHKFHISAELVLASTAARLERGLAMGESLFERHPFVIVSTDFIKSDRRRHEFLRTCPELVIVDEAHSCVAPGHGRGARHQRQELLRGLASREDRHLVLVTATPHSGDEGAFRALLTLLDPSFAALPEELGGPDNEHHRRQLARRFVQRRRADIRAYLDTETPFPERLEREEAYSLSPEYRRLFARVLDYARESVQDPEGARQRQRVRWWSALALLRSLASSPAAAEATLRARSETADTPDTAGADAIGRRSVLDLMDVETEITDVVPGSDYEDPADPDAPNRRRLREMARQAAALKGAKDAKLVRATALVQELIDEGHRPILFCRYIPTADYVAAELRSRLRGGVTVEAVTGRLAPAEREERVLALGEHPRRVLVATDCLSEGINLQDLFDAVLHYDLSWNPTRHEQREGRVDRYGQPRDTVRALTYWGRDNGIDGLVLDVLLRKHKTIRSSLGVSVPVPPDTDALMEAILEGLVLRGKEAPRYEALQLFDDATLGPRREAFFGRWEAAAAREKRSRTMFAQDAIKVEEVGEEVRATRAAIGSGTDVRAFVESAVRACGGVVSGSDPVRLDLSESPLALRDRVPHLRLMARFELPVRDGETHLARTHPVVEALASHLVDGALDPLGEGIARRAGAIRTHAVEVRTTLLLVRLRYDIVSARGGGDHRMLAEECRLLGFEGAPAQGDWLSPEDAEDLLQALPSGNVEPAQAAHFVGRVVDDYHELLPALSADAARRAEELLRAHRRVRPGGRSVSTRVEPQLPPDVLGVYVYLPPLPA